MQLAKVSLQKSNTYHSGLIMEVLEEVEMTSPAGGSDVFVWRDVALSQEYEFEVGEYFIVRFFDKEAASNPFDANEGRIASISDWNGPTQFEMRKVAQKIEVWNGSSQTLAAGYVNPTGYGQNYFWALDFKGNVF